MTARRLKLQLRAFRVFLLVTLPGGAFVHGLPAQDASVWLLKTNAAVTSSGVFLADVVVPPTGVVLPHVRVADAPAFGTAVILRPSDLGPRVLEATQIDPGTNWLGAAQVTVNRRPRALAAADVVELLTAKLTADHLPQGGELELRLTRAWNDVPVPDEPLDVKLVQLPPQGVMPTFSLRFELTNGRESFGPWQVSLHASLWKDVWIAGRALKRGDALNSGDLSLERRDVLAARNHVTSDAFTLAPEAWLLAENLNAGAPLNRWSLRRKPVVYRNQLADALVSHGSLTISLKVQVLEDAVPGQSVRIRNPNTKRELQGKVNDDQTISIQL